MFDAVTSLKWLPALVALLLRRRIGTGAEVTGRVGAGCGPGSRPMVARLLGVPIWVATWMFNSHAAAHTGQAACFLAPGGLRRAARARGGRAEAPGGHHGQQNLS